MNQLDVPKLIAGCCGLSAFAIAIVAGLAADNSIDAIVSRAIMSLGVCFLLGGVVGIIAEAAIRESLASSAEPLKSDQPTGDTTSSRAQE